MIRRKLKIWDEIPNGVCDKLLEKYKALKDDYYWVCFFDTHDEMYNYYDKKFGLEDPTSHNYDGLCKYSSNWYSDDTWDKNCGYILFLNDKLTFETMAHELAHALTFYFGNRIMYCERVFSGDYMEYNELFCYLSGFINQKVAMIVNSLLNKKESE